jgi:NAD(P)-dependent dehydrogenase (short-subunit alcohol dehydrogenase family)
VRAYSAWGAYAASKAALRHLGQTIGVEEPDILTLSIVPGVVDTEIQRELRETHLPSMDEEDAKKFTSLHEEGRLLRPEQPGNVMARLVLDGPRAQSGNMLR